MNTQHALVVSCGILIQSPAGYLLAHATRTPRWDIPKGKAEPGEMPLETALRETREEIGLDFEWAKEKMVDMGQHPYLASKDLHLFHLILEEPLDLTGCRCSTFIDRADGERYPETDGYAWIRPGRLRERIGKGLCAYLVARGVLQEEPNVRSGRRREKQRRR